MPTKTVSHTSEPLYRSPVSRKASGFAAMPIHGHIEAGRTASSSATLLASFVHDHKELQAFRLVASIITSHVGRLLRHSMQSSVPLWLPLCSLAALWQMPNVARLAVQSNPSDWRLEQSLSRDLTRLHARSSRNALRVTFIEAVDASQYALLS